MGEVYGLAKMVLICVGPDSKNQAQGVQGLLADVNTMIDRGLAVLDMNHEKFPWIDESSQLLTDPRWADFKSLLQVRWFSRGWVVQEALLAATATVVWGTTKISWEQLGRAQRWLFRRAQKAVNLYDIRMSDLLWDDFKYRKPVEAKTMAHVTGVHNYTLLEIMSTARHLGMSDPRDRVYAFLGLHRTTPYNMLEYMQLPRDPPSLEYASSHLQVYHKFATGYLEKYFDIELLAFVEHTDKSLAADIPSWYPISDSSWSHLATSDDAAAYVKVLSDTGSKIQVRGVIIDRVVLTSDSFPANNIPLDAALSTVRSFWSAAKLHISPYTHSDRGRHLVRTLRAGRFRGTHEAWKIHEAAYIRLLLGCDEATPDERGWDTRIEGLSGNGDVDYAHSACRERMYGRRIVLTERGYIGLSSAIAQQGDCVGLIFGTATPFLFRKHGEKYQILADAYVESKAGGLLGREDDDRFLGGKDWIEWGLQEEDLNLV